MPFDLCFCFHRDRSWAARVAELFFQDPVHKLNIEHKSAFQVTMSENIGNLNHGVDQTSGQSSHTRQSNHGSQQTSGKSVQPHQSVWMGHWTRSSCKTASQFGDQLLLPCEQHHVRTVPEITTVVSTPTEGARDVTKLEEFEIMDRNLMQNSKILREKGVDCCHLPESSVSQRKANIFSLPKPEIQSRKFRSQPEISLYSELHLKAQHHLEEKSLAVTRTSENYFMGSTSKTVPSGVFSQISPTKSFLHGKQVANQSRLLLASKQHFPNTNHLGHSVMIHEAIYPSHSLDLPVNKLQLCVPVSEDDQDMEDHHGTELFQMQRYPSDVSASENIHVGSSALPRIPYSMHEVETKKICTKVTGGPSKFSQTTHHFFVSKTTDIDMAEGGHILGESTFTLKVKRNPLNQAPYMPLDGHCSLYGADLQTAGSGSDTGGRTHGRDFDSSVKIKNESSSETDTMDMDSIKRGYPCGAASSRLSKEVRGHQNVSSSPSIDLSGEETDNRFIRIELPDMNQKLPEPPNAESPVDDLGSSPSRTQSLDVEHFLPHVEKSITSKSAGFPDGIPVQDPTSRWVKRLKLSSQDSIGYVSKSSKMGEASSYEKVNRIFNKLKRCSITTADQKLGNHRGQEQLSLDRETVLLNKDKCFSTESEKKGQDLTTLYPWIQRWCTNQTPSQQKKPKPEPVVICAPCTSNATLNDLHKQNFPSIAAMALMGKAMSGFQPCEFRKRGSCTLWNVNGF